MAPLLISLPLIILLVKIFIIIFLGLVLLVSIGIIDKYRFKVYLRRVTLIIIFLMILALLFGIISFIPM